MRFITKLLLPSLALVACSSVNDLPAEGAHQAEGSLPTKDFVRLQEIAIAAPVAKKQPYTASYHGQLLSDDYSWLKDSGYPVVDDKPILDYLTKENGYFKAFLAPHTSLVDTLFEEFKGRTDDQETSVPAVRNGYEYSWYYEQGKEYKTHSRKNLKTGKQSVFLDVNKLAEGHEYFVVGDWDISADNRYLVYSYDTAGDERYKARIVDLVSGELLEDELDNVRGDVGFSTDGKAFLYSLLERDRWRAKHIKVHQLGTLQSEDRTVYTEEDEGFFLGFQRTSSGEFYVLGSSRGEAQESYVLPANDLYAKPIQLVHRDANFSQKIDHAHDHFYILANDTHKNFRLAKVGESEPAQKNWQTVVEGSDDVYLLSLKTFSNFIALRSRDLGVENILIRNYQNDSYRVEFDETVFTASIGQNLEFNQDFLRINYESLITPDSVLDYQLDTKKLVSRKVKKIPSGYDKAQFVTERIMAQARDGAKIPVSIVYKKGYKKDASHPLHLYAYGGYGSTVTPTFSTARLSMLERGFAYAIAHVRGGSMMGYQWYLDGKLKKRPNTFNDFEDVARHLIKENYVAEGNISASGRSAGGELMGAAVIQAPELWRSVILGVPFVDVLNTMLDASLPLTPPEWEEWGNPIKSADDYKLIESYSPYDNIQAREYPPMMVTGGLNDPRVTYWEPAKWTAKMRSTKTDSNLLVMRINMGAGHFSNSGRYGRLRDYAEEYAFMLTAHGINE